TTDLLGRDSHVDVRNDGGYIVAAGSRVDTGAGISEYEIEREAPMIPLPYWVLELQEKKRKLSNKQSTQTVAEGIGEGGRNDSLTRIAGALRRQGIGADAIEVALKSLNEELCDPPLEEEEVERIARSVSRYEADE